jgi:ribA/ribD-fused uncharacterized protein
MSYDLEQIEFKNEKRFLSNMWEAPIVFNYPIPYYYIGEGGEKVNGVIEPDVKTYGSSEHIYQALKSKSVNWHNMIIAMEKPTQTKTAARKHLKTLVANDRDTFLIREDWHDIKYFVMLFTVEQKFKQNPELIPLLLEQEGKIEERNCWGDTYWGTVNGKGENHLGKILMELREQFKEGVSYE